MKNTITIALLLIIISCKAQTPVLQVSQVFDISQDTGTENPNGAYYKDTQNLLAPFVGTYQYINGNTSLTIVLQKKTMSLINGRYYEDLIVGEYQYTENGVEKLNTLNNLNTVYTNGWKYNINGNFIITGQSLGCDDCGLTENRLNISLADDTINRVADLDIRRITANGQPAIKINLWWTSSGISQEGDPAPTTPNIPNGEYVLLKQ